MDSDLMRIDEIEARLEGLAPRGLSGSGRVELDALIDDLAAELPQEKVVPVYQKSIVWQCAAAAAVAVVTALALSPSENVATTDAASFAGGAPISSRDVIRSWEDQGRQLREDAQWPVRQVRYDVIEEQDYLDKASGLTVTVLSPEEELRYVPDYSF